MNKEDKEFLKDLQHIMLTQDTVGQADPRFWVVRHLVRTYGIENGYDITGSSIVHEGESIADNLEELCEYIKSTFEDKEINIKYINDGTVEYAILNDDIKFFSINDLVEYIEQEFDYDDISIVNYKDAYQIAEDTMFLTLEECEKHIKTNWYHYKKPHPYAMTAWRSPQVERLFKILQNTNWDDIN